MTVKFQLQANVNKKNDKKKGGWEDTVLLLDVNLKN